MDPYNGKVYSKERLGVAGMVPAVPIMPVACQVSKATGMVHLRLMGESYIRTGLPQMSPHTYFEAVKAVKNCPTEQSWSGSPSEYYKLEVKPSDDGTRCGLWAGTVLVGWVAVFPEAELVSLDEMAHPGAPHDDNDPKPIDPTVN